MKKAVPAHWRGFTVVEMLIYMGLLSLFLVVLSEVFTSLLDAKLESDASAGLQQDGQYIFLRLAYDLERADNFTISGDGQSLASAGLFAYSLDGNNLSNGLANLNGRGTTVSNFQFLRVGNGPGYKDTVKVSFTLTSRTVRRGGPETRNFTTTVGLR